MTLVTIARAGRGTRVRVLYGEPWRELRSWLWRSVLRQQFQLSHSSSPFVKANTVWLLRIAGLASAIAEPRRRWLCYFRNKIGASAGD
jgi:hypothetical protein